MRRTTQMVTVVAVLALGGAAPAVAQEWFYGIEYQTSLSVGDTKEFVNDFSFRNLGVEARGLVKPNLSVGIYLAWNVLHEQTDELISFQRDSLPPLDVSGVQLRTTNAFPMMAQFDYYFGESSPGRSRRGQVIPSIGLGVGTYYDESRLDIGTVSFNNNGWRFGLAPNAQLTYGLSRNSAMYLNARFNWGTSRNDRTLSYFTFSVGIAGR
jgi:hypothetical protein